MGIVRPAIVRDRKVTSLKHWPADHALNLSDDQMAAARGDGNLEPDHRADLR